MKIHLDWLNEYLDRPADDAEAQRLLANQGFPIESSDGQLIDAEITSNRGDCLSHVGLAREVAAGSGRSLKLPDCSLPAGGGEPVEKITSVANEAPGDCPVYTARVIRGVKVGPAPDWLRRRVESIGLRSVSNVVDVTNFVLHELGQPLHAFDLNRLSGKRIVVRHARQDEPFIAIDGSKHRLRADMLVIADAQRPVAVAGVMGGLDSEVGTMTTDVLLESARFAPLSVRRTSRALKLASDSSYRFERGVDPCGVELASRRAARLLVETAGGTLLPGVIRVGEAEPGPRQVQMRIARCEALLGVRIEPRQMVELLQRLGLSPVLDAAAGVIRCMIPTFRGDLEREADLIEEVARLHGLDRVPVREKIQIVARPLQPIVAARQRLGHVLTAQGYHEAVTFSFIRDAHGQPFVPVGAEPLRIEDERRKSEPMLRPSLLPSLLSCRVSNQDAGNRAVALYEVGATWWRRGGEIVETQRLGMLLDAPDAQHAYRLMRGALEELGRSLGCAAALSERADAATPTWLSAGLNLDAGVVGLLAPATQQLFGLHTPVIVAELELDPLLGSFPPTRRVAPLPRYPAIERDLSVVVAQDVPWGAVEQSVRGAAPAALEELRFVGVYRGRQVPTGKKSVTFRLMFRDPSATLRHEQVEPQVAAVVERLRNDLGAELRA